MKEKYKVNWEAYKWVQGQCDGLIEMKSERDKMIWGLYARIDALAEESIEILNSERGVGCPLLIRAILESFIDMKCLIEDPDHVCDIQARHLSKEIKHLKNFSEENVFYHHENQGEVDERLKFLKEKLAGRTPLSIHDRFKKVDELGIYHTVYHTLSEGSHPSMTNIAQGYDGECFSLVNQPHALQLNFYYTSTINFASSSLVELLVYNGIESGAVRDLKDNGVDINNKGREFAARYQKARRVP